MASAVVNHATKKAPSIQMQFNKIVCKMASEPYPVLKIIPTSMTVVNALNTINNKKQLVNNALNHVCLRIGMES